MERKRTATQRSTATTSDEVDKPREEESLRTSLKHPRVSKRARGGVLKECLQLETADQVLESLLHVNESVHSRMLEDWKQTAACFKKLWKKYRNSVSVCSVIIHLVSKLLPSVTPTSSVTNSGEFILSLVHHESPEVVAAALHCWSMSHKVFSDELITKCLEEAVQLVYHANHSVRVECLNLIGHISHTASQHENILVLVIGFCSDSDPRVRQAAASALLLMHQNGVDLSLNVYMRVSDLLADDEEIVRTTAVKLVHTLGLIHAESTVPLRHHTTLTLRVVDDAFIKVCNMINDSSVSVRALAATFLGQFPSVSQQFLDQTLDKKLMSHLRVVKSEHERARELHQAGGARDWDTGQKWGGGLPKIDFDPTDISLMSAGACGAFVHSLEDEFYEVRTAAVISMGQLSQQSNQFASQCLDFLVDLFNDEIVSVRLRAIRSLQLVSGRIELREDQLETVLGVLEESSREIRTALHELLSSCHITSSAGLHLTLHALLNNLKRYPLDQTSVWKCLRVLGGNHAHLVATMVPQLLSTHPFFMSKEPDVDDPAYVCVLILVFNAAHICSTIPPLFPSHVFRHYSYLHDTLPSLIPSLKLLGTHSRHESIVQPSSTSASSFLKNVLCQATTLPPCGQDGESRVLESCIASLCRVASLEPSLSSCALYSSTLLQCRQLLHRVQAQLCKSVVVVTSPAAIATDLQELMLLSYRLQYTFAPLTPVMILTLQLLRVSATASFLLLTMQQEFHTKHNERFLKLLEGFVERVQCVNSYCSQHNLPLPPSLQAVGKELVTMPTTSIHTHLQPISAAALSSPLSVDEVLRVHQASVELLEPKNTTRESSLPFLSSLALSVPVSATVQHIEDCSSVAVQVMFPDSRRLLYPLKSSEIHQSAPNSVQLNTNLILSHSTWTDPSAVEVCLVQKFTPDIAQEYQCISLLRELATGRQRGRGGGDSSSLAHPEDNVREDGGLLVLGEVVKVTIHPQNSLSKGYNVFGS